MALEGKIEDRLLAFSPMWAVSVRTVREIDQGKVYLETGNFIPSDAMGDCYDIPADTKELSARLKPGDRVLIIKTNSRVSKIYRIDGLEEVYSEK